MPSEGRPHQSILEDLRGIATEEDAFWETGKCSGTMYCGDHDHYAFMNDVFALFSHTNILQRDMFPIATKFESEVIAMTLDLLHAEAVTDANPAGMVTSGGSGSILHSVLAYREYARDQRGIDRPNLIKPETGHPAFDKACHLLGVEMRRAPINPDTTQVELAAVEEMIDGNTIAMIGSACNYGYGTVDDIPALSDLALSRGVGLHVDGCLGGFILPWGLELGYDIPLYVLILRHSVGLGVTSMKWDFGGVDPRRLRFDDVSNPNVGFHVAPGAALLWPHGLFEGGVGFDYLIQIKDALPSGFVGKLLVGVKL